MIQNAVSSFIVELNYMQQWWLVFFAGLVIIYVGIKGFFTDTTKLKKLDFSFTPNRLSIPELDKAEAREVSPEVVSGLELFMEKEKPYLNPELNLMDLAKLTNMNRGQLSETINAGFGKNI